MDRTRKSSVTRLEDLPPHVQKLIREQDQKGQVDQAKRGNARKSKFGAEPVVIDGYRFASKGEGAFYEKLKLLKTAGEVEWFAVQATFILAPGITYRADFIVNWGPLGGGPKTEVIDFKGHKTPEYKLKKKLAASQGINIIEVT